MNIAFFTPVTFRCRDIESLIEKFIGDGVNVFLISYDSQGELQKACSVIGAQLVTIKRRAGHSYYSLLNNVWSLVQICRTQKIHVLYSHLEPTNFVSVLAQYFVRAEVIIFRHHIDEAALYKFDKSLAYVMTYKLARTVICVSAQAKKYMVTKEGVLENKIHHINLGYNFEKYWTVDKRNADHLRHNLPSSIHIVTAGRLTQFKRPHLSIEVLRQLKNTTNLSVRLTFLGVGEYESSLKEIIKREGLEEFVSFEGYRHNIGEYLHAADILLHPSVLESSCVVIKEAALANLPVIVCGGVGDFDDYLQDAVNATVVERDHFVTESVKHLRNFAEDPTPYRMQATALKRVILQRFSIESTYPQHLNLLAKKKVFPKST